MISIVEDLLKFGLIPEFVGRLPVIATLHDLDVDALVTILQEPKNALVKQYKKLFELEDVELTFTDEALKEIAEKAILRKTGARGLRSIVDGILLDTMFDLPDMEDVTEIVIDADVVHGRKDPIQIETPPGRRIAERGSFMRCAMRGIRGEALWFSLDQPGRNTPSVT